MSNKQTIEVPVNDHDQTFQIKLKKPEAVGQADTRFDPSENYDGAMFLNDRPIYLDPEQVPVTEVTRILGPAGFINQTRVMPKNYHKLYNPGQPYS